MSKILVVDDNRFSREMIKAALRDSNFEFIEACDGKEALDLVEHQQIDLVILDLLMPVMEGTVFLQKLRDTGSQLPVIVVSADIQENSRLFCEELGIVAFLGKPLHVGELNLQVERALSGVYSCY